MKRKQQDFIYLLTILTFVGLFYFACKKEDDTPPVITFESPIKNAAYNEGDTVMVSAKVSDETSLTYVKLFLFRNDGKIVLTNYDFPLQSNVYELNKPYLLNDIHLLSGKYYFEIDASDGHNVSKSYQYIYINGAPRKTKDYFYVTSTGSNTLIHKVSAENYGSSVFISLPGDFSDAAINDFSQQIDVAGAMMGNLVAVDAENTAMLWQIQNNAGTLYPYFNRVEIDTENHYVYASIHSGYVRSYDISGGTSGSFSASSGFYPNTFCVGDTFLVASERKVGSADLRLTTYYKKSGAMANSQSIIGLDSIKDMFMAPGGIVYCFANSGADGEIYKYHAEPHYGNVVQSISSEKILCATPFLVGSFLIGTADKVYQFNTTTNSLLTVLNVGANHIKYDSVNGRIILSRGNNFEIYDENNHNLLFSTTASSNVLDVMVLYNK